MDRHVWLPPDNAAHHASSSLALGTIFSKEGSKMRDKTRRLRPSELRRLRLIVRRCRCSRPNRRARCWFDNRRPVSQITGETWDETED